ncbi:MAG: TIGR00341 family protein [Halobacteriaceae archaeon]
MRLVQVTIPAGKRSAVTDILDDEGIDYVMTDETSGRDYVGVLYFPLPPAAVEPILDALRDEIGEDAYTVVVDAETVISRQFEELRNRYEAEDNDSDRVARQELLARAADLAPDLPIYLALTIVSVVVATAGVLMDSPAVVVGSMVIAPLIGPAMATSVGSVLNETSLFRRGVWLQSVGGVVAIGAATVFAILVKEAYLVPPGTDIATITQVQGRVAPGVLSLAVALGAGVAGALSLSATVSSALVGVAIAVALIPPVAVIGIAIAWGQPLMAAGALVLVLVNFLSINAAAMATLWYEGYRPEHWFHLPEAKAATLRRLAVLALAIGVLSLFLGGVTYTSFQQASFEQTVSDTVHETVADYPNLKVVNIQVMYGDEFLVRQPNRVVVTLDYPIGTDPPPGLAEVLANAVHDATGRQVQVTVRYTTVERTDVISYSSYGNSGSYPIASTTAATTVSTFSSSVTLM